MPRPSRVEGCLVKEHVEWEALVRALSRVLSVSPADIRAFDVEQLITPPPVVLVECHERESGFRMDLTLYLGPEVRSELVGVPLASSLAMALGQEVLTSPPGGADGLMPPPDSWVLACPDGSLFLVRQSQPDSEDVEIDRAPHHMQRLPDPLKS
jgi:hypothetical protein